MTARNAVIFRQLGIVSVRNTGHRQNTGTDINEAMVNMTKYKITSNPPEKIYINSFEAEAFFEGIDDGNEVTMKHHTAKIPLDCCVILSDKEAAEEEEKWVLSEYG